MKYEVGSHFAMIAGCAPCTIIPAMPIITFESRARYIKNPIIFFADDGIAKNDIYYLITLVEPSVSVKSSIKTSPPGFLLFIMTRL